ncbi:hypothetical protein [Aequorivita antarctica]|uniref:Lipocalin-like domain-containing protein n=1 Tax=Aequorivita antarctica TaxID=153266 RepID=A0A5C6Z1Z8_9FLAO|nr:hypothetical protein [Aequorivita antarctica]TXD74098.1 hypothetical protein ESU54_06380 [Aequorivita antarctica]SRX73179.1 hypothetical protein AEQU3_00614 [Aequorivita antarctica]
MKLTKLIFLFALTIATVSCSKNDDDNNAPDPYKLTTANFVDTYSMNFLELKVVETVTFNNGSTSTSSSTTRGSIFQNVNFVFNADGTFAASGLYTTVETVINPDGSTVTNDPVIRNAAEEIGAGTYILNPTSKILTVIDQDDNQVVFEITIYSETEMRLYSEMSVTSGNSTTVTTQDLRFSR